MSEANQPATTDLTCDQCRELLSDYVDRELSDSEKSAVERHLKSCSKCTTESVRLMGLKNVVRNWDGVKGSGEFRKSVVQQMIRESQQMPADQFNAAVKAGSVRSGTLIEDDEDAGKTLPPAWILLVALFLAMAAYFGITMLRGGF